MSLNMELFEQIAMEKGCDIAFPIKEHFLIQVIQQLVSRFHSADGDLIFGGGTSLVCAYDELTKRFSEDADFRFVPRPKSTANVRKLLTDIAHSLDGFELIPIQGLVETIIVSKDEEGTTVTVYVGGAYDRILARALTSKIADHFISYLKNETTH